MKPHKVEIYLYAENEQEAFAARQALYDFVSDAYNNGALVTARKIVETVKRFKGNPFVMNFLKK